MVGVGKWYNELPLKYKLGASAALLGVSLATGGVGLFAGVAVGRRLFGALTAGVGTRLGLEAKGQKKDQAKAEKERDEFLKSLEGLSPEEKYKKLEDNIKNISIKDEKNSIDQIKNQDLKQIGTGAMMGAFLASGWAGDLLRKGIHFGGKEIHELWQHFAGHHMNVPPLLSSHGHIESLTVNKGSSFEGTLLKYLHEHHGEVVHSRPEFANLNDGQIADRLAHEFTNSHPNMEGHLPDYIHAGAKLDLNPSNMHIEIHDPQGHGWYENVPDHNNAGIPAPHDTIPAPPVPAAETIPPPPPLPVHDVIPPPPPADLPYGNMPPPPPVDMPFLTPEIFIHGNINTDHFVGMSHAPALREVREGMFHRPQYFHYLKDVSVLNGDGRLNVHELHQAGLSADRHEMIKKFATSRQYPEMRPRIGETFGRWSTRATATVVNHANAVGRRG